MAQLVIAAAGAAIGGLTLGTGVIAGIGLTGTAIGWAVGSVVGSMFGPKQKGEGPRLNDLTVTSSAYGTPIPYVLGSPRLAGQIIWASNKREIATTTEQGKGGGGGSEYTSYTYEVDALILLTDNVVPGISRIWQNGDLAWNKSASADPATIAASDTAPEWRRITFYDGNPAQLPDPTYEAAVGSPNALAYRGRGSVFIEGWQLGSSGQIHNETFEIGRPGVVLVPGPEIAFAKPAQSIHSVGFASDRSMAVFQSTGGYIEASVARPGVTTSNIVSGNPGYHPIFALLSPTKGIVSWIKSASPYTFLVTVGDISGGAPGSYFSTGADYTLATPTGFGSSLSHLVVGAISATQALAVYVDVTAKMIYARVLGVSGTVVALGNPIANAALVTAMSLESIVMLTSTTALIVGNLSGGGLNAIVVTISGTTCSIGAPVVVPHPYTSTSVINQANGLAYVDASSALCTFLGLGTGFAVPCVVRLTVSGLGVSVGVPVQLQDDAGVSFENVNIARLTASLYIVAWSKGTPDYNIYAMPISSAGGAIGEPVQVSTTIGERPAIAGVNDTDAILVWRARSGGNLRSGLVSVA